MFGNQRIQLFEGSFFQVKSVSQVEMTYNRICAISIRLCSMPQYDVQSRKIACDPFDCSYYEILCLDFMFVESNSLLETTSDRPAICHGHVIKADCLTVKSNTRFEKANNWQQIDHSQTMRMYCFREITTNISKQ